MRKQLSGDSNSRLRAVMKLASVGDSSSRKVRVHCSEIEIGPIRLGRLPNCPFLKETESLYGKYAIKEYTMRTVCLVVCVVFCALVAQTATITVNTTGNGNARDGALSLTEAILLSNGLRRADVRGQ